MMNRVFGALGMAAWKAWLVFSLTAVVGAVLFIFLDGDNPLRSDDPYIAGNLFGGVAAVLAVFHVLVWESTGKRRVAHVASAVLLSLWCGFLFVSSLTPSEGSGILKYLSVTSLAAGMLAWPLVNFELGRKWEIAISCLGVLFWLGYVQVAIHMANRTF
jgi:hypothetical protein